MIRKTAMLGGLLLATGLALPAMAQDSAIRIVMGEDVDLLEPCMSTQSTIGAVLLQRTPSVGQCATRPQSMGSGAKATVFTCVALSSCTCTTASVPPLPLLAQPASTKAPRATPIHCFIRTFLCQKLARRHLLRRPHHMLP